MKQSREFIVARERKFIGLCMLDRSHISRSIGKLRSQTFRDSRCGIIYKALRALLGESVARLDPKTEIDEVAVVNWLHKNGRLADAGGSLFVSGLVEEAPARLTWQASNAIIRSIRGDWEKH